MSTCSHSVQSTSKEPNFWLTAASDEDSTHIDQHAFLTEYWLRHPFLIGSRFEQLNRLFVFIDLSRTVVSLCIYTHTEIPCWVPRAEFIPVLDLFPPPPKSMNVLVFLSARKPLRPSSGEEYAALAANERYHGRTAATARR